MFLIDKFLCWQASRLFQSQHPVELWKSFFVNMVTPLSRLFMKATWNPRMTLWSSTFQCLLEEIIKMSESAVMSAEDFMRSSMLARDQANSAWTAKWSYELQHQYWPEHQHCRASLLDGRFWWGDSACLPVRSNRGYCWWRLWLTGGGGGSSYSGCSHELMKNDGQSHHHQLDQIKPSVSHMDSMLTAVRSSAGAGWYIPSPIQMSSELVIRLASLWGWFQSVLCGFCKTDSTTKNLRKCLCGKISYSNEKCQANAWRSHQTNCPPYRVEQGPSMGRGLFAPRKIKNHKSFSII